MKATIDKRGVLIIQPENETEKKKLTLYLERNQDMFCNYPIHIDIIKKKNPPSDKQEGF